MARAFIGIGSNIEPARNVAAAVRCLANETRVTGVSMVYCTEPIGRLDQPHYFNGVVEAETEAAPAEFKNRVLAPIEDMLGRVRSKDKYAPRTIDLDLILYGDLAVDSDGIRLPDPEILERAFLAIPLFELAPDLVLPGYNLPIGEIAARFPCNGMKPLKEYARTLRQAAICRPTGN